MKTLNHEIVECIPEFQTACLNMAHLLQANIALRNPIYDTTAAPMLISLLFDAVSVGNQLIFFKDSISQDSMRPMLKMASSTLEITADVMNYSLHPREYLYYMKYADARGVGDQVQMDAMAEKVKMAYHTPFTNICTRFYVLGREKSAFASVHPNMIRAISQMRENYRVTLYSHHSGIENVNTLEDYQAAQLVISIYAYCLLGATYAVSNFLQNKNHLAFNPLLQMEEVRDACCSILNILEGKLLGNPLERPTYISKILNV